ncbi:complement C1q-like protein 2 [Protopterus annectens]|uniref:complement C1q-like protein 2 n=1 Tax=Protopterus annectens TaxID=7888 RepID=UPI001CFA5D07|nr:complement C1q-like protein 2 [Protopterus annectens]
MKFLSIIVVFIFSVNFQIAASAENTNSNIRESNSRLCDCVMQSEIHQLKEQVNSLQEELKKMKAVPRIAFSAGLSSGAAINLGPFQTPTTIVFPKVMINLGSSYNPSTGIFTALIRGVYCFSYTLFRSSAGKVAASLMRNGSQVTSSWDSDTNDVNDSYSNTVILELDVGDNVYMRLFENRQIYDDQANYTWFSGFLLYPQ